MQILNDKAFHLSQHSDIMLTNTSVYMNMYGAGDSLVLHYISPSHSSEFTFHLHLLHFHRTILRRNI